MLCGNNSTIWIQTDHSLTLEAHRMTVVDTTHFSCMLNSLWACMMSIQITEGCLCCPLCCFSDTTESWQFFSVQWNDTGKLFHGAPCRSCFVQISFLSTLFPLKCKSVSTVGSTSINTLLVFPSVINKCVLQRACSSIFSPESCRHQSLRDIVWSPILISNKAPLHHLPLHLKLLQCQTANHHHH